MRTHCITIDLANQGRRQVRARFDGGRMSSDGGDLLLQAVDQRIGLTRRLAACFVDHRNPRRCEHSLQRLLAQRLFGLALGYEDLCDHDRGYPLAGSSTLNRLELGTPEQAPQDRYKRIVADPQRLDALLVELFLDSHAAAPEEIVLDVDATDDPLHGRQEGRFFHGYYDCYCYLPLYVTCGRRRRDSLWASGRDSRGATRGGQREVCSPCANSPSRTGQSAPEPVPVDADMATRGDS